VVKTHRVVSGALGGATGCDCRSTHDGLDADQKRHNGERSILRNSRGKAVLGGQTFRVSLWSGELDDGDQHKIVEIPTICLEPFEKVAMLAGRVFDRALHVTLQCGVAVVEKISRWQGQTRQQIES
jgi:hypothetical protein